MGVLDVGIDRHRVRQAEAIRAAETGHLVFTTLHTRDAKGAITRYADLFPPDVQRDIRAQLALSLRAIVAQRLVRRTCMYCQTEEPVPGGVFHLFGDDVPAALRRGAGCP